MELYWTPEAIQDREVIYMLRVLHAARQWP